MRRACGVLGALAFASAVAAVAVAASDSAWRPLPHAPIAGRVYEGAVWTGSEMLVWGGVGRHGDLSDGAAYNPATRSWRKIAPLPRGARGDAGGAFWTGRTVVFWAGNSPDGPAVGAVYHPKANTWRRLPSGPLGPRELYASVWTGRDLLIVGGANGDAFATPVAGAVDPSTGTWHVVHAFDRLKGFLPSGAVWDGHEAFVLGSLSLCPEKGSACTKRRSVLVTYNPVAGTLRELTLASGVSLKPIAWSGRKVLFIAAASDSLEIVSYDPTTRRWETGPKAPCRVPETDYGQSAWLGDAYAAACGTNRLQIYSVASGRWRTIEAGRSALNYRANSAIVWTGRELIAWGGSVDRRHHPNPLPATGASLDLHG